MLSHKSKSFHKSSGPKAGTTAKGAGTSSSSIGTGIKLPVICSCKLARLSPGLGMQWALVKIPNLCHSTPLSQAIWVERVSTRKCFKCLAILGAVHVRLANDTQKTMFIFHFSILTLHLNIGCWWLCSTWIPNDPWGKSWSSNCQTTGTCIRISGTCIWTTTGTCVWTTGTCIWTTGTCITGSWSNAVLSTCKWPSIGWSTGSWSRHGSCWHKWCSRDGRNANGNWVRCAGSSSLKCKSKWGTWWHPPSPSHWHWCLGFWLHFIHHLLPIAWCHWHCHLCWHWCWWYWDSWDWTHFRCQSMLLLCTNLGSRPLTKKQANVLSIGNGLLCPWPLVDSWDQEWFIKAKGTCNVSERLRCQDKGKLAQHLHLKWLLSNCTHNSVVGLGKGIIQLAISTHSLAKKEAHTFPLSFQCCRCWNLKTKKVDHNVYKCRKSQTRWFGFTLVNIQRQMRRPSRSRSEVIVESSVSCKASSDSLILVLGRQRTKVADLVIAADSSLMYAPGRLGDGPLASAEPAEPCPGAWGVFLSSSPLLESSSGIIIIWGIIIILAFFLPWRPMVINIFFYSQVPSEFMSPVNQRSELSKVMQTSQCKVTPQTCTQQPFFHAGIQYFFKECVFGTSSESTHIFCENLCFCFIFQNLA